MFKQINNLPAFALLVSVTPAKTLLPLVLLLTVTVFPGCSGPPSTESDRDEPVAPTQGCQSPEELGKAVIAALRSEDLDAFQGLCATRRGLVNTVRASSLSPEEKEKAIRQWSAGSFAGVREMRARNFSKLAARIDWSEVVVDRVELGWFVDLGGFSGYLYINVVVKDGKALHINEVAQTPGGWKIIEAMPLSLLEVFPREESAPPSTSEPEGAEPAEFDAGKPVVSEHKMDDVSAEEFADGGHSTPSDVREIDIPPDAREMVDQADPLDAAQVLELLGHRDDRVGRYAAERFGDMFVAAPALVQALLHDDPVVRDRGAAAALCCVADLQKGRGIRQVARSALVRERIAGQTPDLIKSLDDNNRQVRLAAIVFLRFIGPNARDAVPALERLAENDEEDEEIRVSAEHALSSIQQ